MASKLNFKTIRLGGAKIWSKKGFYLFKSVGKWLNDIINAEVVITDSFHCTVFSIIFHKKFICIANPHKGTTRLENLLKLLGLENHLLMDISQINEKILFRKINYEKVELVLEKERSKSINFLKDKLALVSS